MIKFKTDGIAEQKHKTNSPEYIGRKLDQQIDHDAVQTVKHSITSWHFMLRTAYKCTKSLTQLE